MNSQPLSTMTKTQFKVLLNQLLLYEKACRLLMLFLWSKPNRITFVFHSCWYSYHCPHIFPPVSTGLHMLLHIFSTPSASWLPVASQFAASVITCVPLFLMLATFEKFDLCWHHVLFSISSSDKLKLLLQPDHPEILSYTLGLLSLVIASTSRFPAICRAVRENHWKCFFLSTKQSSALLIFCCSPFSTEATSGLGHMWSPGCFVQLRGPCMLLRCSSMTLALGFWWESCRGWCQLSAAPSWMSLYPCTARCRWLWSSFAVATVKNDDNIPVRHHFSLNNMLTCWSFIQPSVRFSSSTGSKKEPGIGLLLCPQTQRAFWVVLPLRIQLWRGHGGSRQWDK